MKPYTNFGTKSDSARSALVSIFLLLAAYFGTYCPFYAIGHHIWIFSLFFALFLVKEDFSPLKCANSPRLNQKSSKPMLVLALIGAFIPIAWVLVTWSHEFPWLADNNFHFPMAHYVRHAPWTYPVIGLWVLLGLSYIQFRKGNKTNAWYIVGAAALITIAIEILWPVPLAYARYPVTSYVLQSPLQGVMKKILGYESINTNRLFESLAPFIWIFVLRPLVLKRRLSWEIIITLFLFVAQPDSLFLLGSAYIEPWSLSFCLLAFEALFVCHDFRIAFAAIGTAAVIKEQCVLFFPFFFLAAFCQENFKWHRIFNLGIWFLLSLTPFLSYFLYRKDADIFRTADAIPLSVLFRSDRLHEWFYNTKTQFSAVGAWCLLAMILLILYTSWKHKRRFVTEEICGVGAAIFIVLFFYCDRMSVSWTGYHRFQIISYLIILFMAALLARKYRSKVLYLVLAVFGLSQSPRFAHVWTFADELESNFFEHFESPLFLPIRRLVTEAEKRHLVDKGSAIQIVALTAFDVLKQFDMGYPDLNNQFRIQINYKEIKSIELEESPLRPLTVLVPLVRMTNINAPGLPYGLQSLFSAQYDAAKRVERKILQLGGTWSDVVDKNNNLLGYIGHLK